MFYTYLHCKPDGTPFYVGKGSGNRARQLKKNRNTHFLNTVAKYGRDNIQVYIFHCDNERQAFSDEIQQIAQLSAEGYKLSNLTGGGEGPSGHVHDEAARQKMSDFHAGRPKSEEHKQKIAKALTGKKRPEFSQEWRDKIAKAGLKREVSDETRKKLAANAIGNKYALGLKRGPMSAEQKAKVSAAKKGAIPWNKGLKLKCQ